MFYTSSPTSYKALPLQAHRNKRKINAWPFHSCKNIDLLSKPPLKFSILSVGESKREISVDFTAFMCTTVKKNAY